MVMLLMDVRPYGIIFTQVYVIGFEVIMEIVFWLVTRRVVFSMFVDASQVLAASISRDHPYTEVNKYV